MLTSGFDNMSRTFPFDVQYIITNLEATLLLLEQSVPWRKL